MTRAALPMPLDHLDGRHVGEALRPLVPRVTALVDAVVRLRIDVDDVDPGRDAEVDQWSERLWRMAGELLRLLAGQEARQREADRALAILRDGDIQARQAYEAIAGIALRLLEDTTLGYEKEPAGLLVDRFPLDVIRNRLRDEDAAKAAKP